MSTNRDFVDKLRSPRSRFCLCDFHVHSPASYDVRANHFDELAEHEKLKLEEIPKPTQDNLVDYQEKVLTSYPPEDFYQEIVSRRNEVAQKEGLHTSEDWSLLAITDHNVCEYSCQVAEISWKKRGENRLIVLPAIELDVEYTVPNAGDRKVRSHILCIFSPETKSTDIRHSISTAASGIRWEEGDPVLRIDDLPEFISNMRRSPKNPAICIAAHIGSSKGVQKETKSALMNYHEAAITQLRSAAIEKTDSKELEEIESQIDKIVKDQRDGIDSLETLNLIGKCGFDAIQVSGPEDEKHYRHLHRFNREYGRSVPIICSDAHIASKIFDADGKIPHIKIHDELLAKASSGDFMDGLRTQALRCGETRFSYTIPGRVTHWIEGIEIVRDAEDAVEFWATDESFILPFSRNLNCLIGGRGSGKSAILEALGFLTKPEDFDRKSILDQDCYNRAEATLNGCKVRLCWKYAGTSSPKELRKGLFVSRYFDPRNKHSNIELTDIDGSDQGFDTKPPNVQIFRFHEIEETANPDGLRDLFDDICGEDVTLLEKDIEELLDKLIKQRSEILDCAREIVGFTAVDSPLRKYAKNYIEYQKANKPEVQKYYKALDQAEYAGKLAGKCMEGWSDISKDLALESRKEEIHKLFTDLSYRCLNEDGTLRNSCGELNQLLDTNNDKYKKVIGKMEELEEHLTLIKDIFESTINKLRIEYTEKKDDLTSRGLPVGGKDREAKRLALDESKETLEQYKKSFELYQSLQDERLALFQELTVKCKQRTNLREDTANAITSRLSQDLDDTVLVIEAKAQARAEHGQFRGWLENIFLKIFHTHKLARADALIRQGVMPEALRDILYGKSTASPVSILANNIEMVADGKITSEDADFIIDNTKAIITLDPEVAEEGTPDEIWKELPSEIKGGLQYFPENKVGELRLENVLKLDELVFDDKPVIYLNDRPATQGSILRPIEELSHGQRCSAVLPILLLNGKSPLIIDQPEDNLDNRLIRQVIVNVLANIKLRRQVIVATHNPNIPVLGDAEQTIVLCASEDKKAEMIGHGDLDNELIAHEITEVMEGGREAFQYRAQIYDAHWKKSAVQKTTLKD